MRENGSETLSGWSLVGSAARLRDSNAIIKSTHPAGRRALNSEMNSAPKISSRSRSNSWSIPIHNRQHDRHVKVKGAITSKIKHAIKHKTSPARLAQPLQPSLAFCFSLQSITAYRPGRHWLQAKNKTLMRAATVVQVLQDLFYVLLYVLFYL